MSCDGNEQCCNYWLKLPRDITVMILQKVGFLQILMSAQLVCTEWRNIVCTEPSMWSTISAVDWDSYKTPKLNFDEYTEHVKNMIKWAVDQSCGSLFDLDLDTLMSEELLHYVVDRCTQIRRLRGKPHRIIEGVLGKVVARLPILEDLELLVGVYGGLSLEAIENLGRNCPRLRSFKFHGYAYAKGDEEVEAIARSMPQLRHICFLKIGSGNLVTHVGLEALLDGCPHLESLILEIRRSNTYGVWETFQMIKELPSNPSTWSTIRVDIETYVLSSTWYGGKKFKNVNFKHVEDLIRLAVDKSCGGLVDVDLGIFIYEDDILSYVVERCTQIRRLRGSGRRAHVYNCGTLSIDTIQTIGRCCPLLTSLEIPIQDDEGAKILARSLPQLRHIFLSGKNFVTDVGLEALLDGCPHLESLVLALSAIAGAFRMMKLPLTRTHCRDIPSTWSTIHVDRRMSYYYYLGRENFKHMKNIIQCAVDKSYGGLVDVDLDIIMSGYTLSYVVERCTQIRRLRGHMPSLVCAEKALRTAAPRLPLLENLQLDYDDGGTLSAEIIKILRRCCPRLTSLEIPIDNDEGAKTLARFLRQLRHLKPVHAYKLTDVGIEAFLDGCPNLESLDLVDCNHVRLYGSLGIRCAQQIKHLQRPKRYYCRSYSCCGLIKYQTTYELEKISEARIRKQEAEAAAEEEGVHDANYIIDSREEHWSRRGKARGIESYIRHLRSEKCIKNRLNTNTERDQKARRRRELKTDSRKEVKKEFIHWNKMATNPYTLYNILI